MLSRKPKRSRLSKYVANHESYISHLIALQALREFSPDEAKVLRSGRLLKVHASDLVPGDIVAVSVGDKIPADCRLLSISSSSFRVDQAILTGESMSVSKSIDTVADVKAVNQDQWCILFSVRSISVSYVSY